MENSNVIATIKIEPFYQTFLRGYFNNYDTVFSFPRASRKNWLPIALKAALWYPPNDYKKQNYGEEAFYINIPKDGDKDPNSMNYISEEANKEFVKKIKDFYAGVWYPFLHEMIAGGYGPKATANMFMDRYNISPEYSDRIYKDSTRYRKYIHNNNWRKNRQAIKQKHKKNISFSS